MAGATASMHAYAQQCSRARPSMHPAEELRLDCYTQDVGAPAGTPRLLCERSTLCGGGGGHAVGGAATSPLSLLDSV